MGDIDFSDIENEFKERLVELLGKYDRGEIDLIECANENRKLAYSIVKKNADDLIEGRIYIDEDIEQYEKLKWLGWKVIKKSYEKNRNKCLKNDNEFIDFIEISYRLENDI